MSASTAIMIIQFLLGQAKEVYLWAKQNHGEAIPEWDEITGKFDAMQSRLDAAKVKNL